jgi:hypothetical protein
MAAKISTAVRPRHASRTSRGAVAVEFAIILPLFLALLFAMLDFGRFMYHRSIAVKVLTAADRAAAIFPSISAEDCMAEGIKTAADQFLAFGYDPNWIKGLEGFYRIPPDMTTPLFAMRLQMGIDSCMSCSLLNVAFARPWYTMTFSFPVELRMQATSDPQAPRVPNCSVVNSSAVYPSAAPQADALNKVLQFKMDSGKRLMFFKTSPAATWEVQ